MFQFTPVLAYNYQEAELAFLLEEMYFKGSRVASLGLLDSTKDACWDIFKYSPLF